MTKITNKYYEDPLLKTLTTTVVSSTEKNGQHLVVLREQLFYPTGGGQPHDLGSLNGEPLLDVFEENDIIYHVLANPLKSKEVKCVLDWNRRFDHMQQHTGQHLLSAVFEDLLGYKTESFHLGEDYSSIDITTPDLTRSEQILVETQVQERIVQNLPISVYQVANQELTQLPLRKLPDLEGDLRIVEIAEFDYSPCSGTHLNSTGQLQLLKIIKVEKYKGMTRVYFLAGNRALSDYSRKHEITSSLVSLVGVPAQDLSSRWEQERQTRRELIQKLDTVQAELLTYHAKEIVSKAEHVALFLDLPLASLEEGQNLIRAILNLGSFYVVAQLPERLLLAHNLPTGVNLGDLVKQHAPPLGGRGGGSPTNAQVYFTNPENLASFVRVLHGLLENN